MQMQLSNRHRPDEEIRLSIANVAMLMYIVLLGIDNNEKMSISFRSLTRVRRTVDTKSTMILTAHVQLE